MQQGYSCPRCGKALRYLPQYQNWFCDHCRVYPFQQQMPMPYYPPRDDSTRTVILIVVIVIVLVIIVPIIIAVAMYFWTSGTMVETETTPGVGLVLEETDESGRYYGSYLGSVENDRIEISILDASEGEVAVMDTVQNDATVSAGNLDLTYSDTNGDDNLDAGDRLTITGGGTGDRVTIIYKPTGEIIATAMIT